MSFCNNKIELRHPTKNRAHDTKLRQDKFITFVVLVENAVKGSLQKFPPEGKSPLGRPRQRWEDNFKVDIQEVGCRGMDCIELVRDRDGWRTLVNAVMNF